MISVIEAYARRRVKDAKRHFETLLAQWCRVYQYNNPHGHSPRVAIDDLAAHLAHNPQLGSATEINPAQDILLPNPRGISIRKLDWLDRIGPQRLSPEWSFVLFGARITGGYAGAVFDGNNALLRQLSVDPFGWGWHRSSRWLALPRLKRYDGRTLLLATPEAFQNYYHALIDWFPSLLAAKNTFGDLTSFDHIVTSVKPTPYRDELLEAVGLPPERVEVLSLDTHIHAEELSTVWWPEARYSPHPQRLKRIYPSIPETRTSLASKQVLLTRRSGTRRISNMDEVEAFCKANGFTVMDPGEYRISEQRSSLAHAEVVIAPHGAAMANIIFAPEGCHIIELCHPGNPEAYYWSLAGVRHQPHTFVQGRAIRPYKCLAGTRVNRHGFAVDLDALAAVLGTSRG